MNRRRTQTKTQTKTTSNTLRFRPRKPWHRQLVLEGLETRRLLAGGLEVPAGDVLAGPP